MEYAVEHAKGAVAIPILVVSLYYVQISRVINGNEKVEKVRSWISNKKNSITDESVNDILAYADSEIDIPLFQLATYPVVVNPN